MRQWPGVCLIAYFMFFGVYYLAFFSAFKVNVLLSLLCISLSVIYLIFRSRSWPFLGLGIVLMAFYEILTIASAGATSAGWLFEIVIHGAAAIIWYVGKDSVDQKSFIQ